MGPPTKVFNILAIGLLYSCCHSALYSLNSPSVCIPPPCHSIQNIAEYYPHRNHPRLYSNSLNNLPSSPRHEGGELGGV